MLKREVRRGRLSEVHNFVRVFPSVVASPDTDVDEVRPTIGELENMTSAVRSSMGT